MVHYVDPLTSLHPLVSHDVFETTIIVKKDQCIVPCDLFVIELVNRFLNDELINVFGVIYSQCQIVIPLLQLIGA
jgi:hypothetical protein